MSIQLYDESGKENAEGEGEEELTTSKSKTKTGASLEGRMRIVKTFFYHFVNSPVGLFIQNGVIIAWVFFYPSVLSVFVLLVSAFNTIHVKSEKIDEYIIISPHVWSQNLMIVCTVLVGIAYYVLTSGLAPIVEKNTLVYYLLLGGLTQFNTINWFAYLCIFFMGWVATVGFIRLFVRSFIHSFIHSFVNL